MTSFGNFHFTNNVVRFGPILMERIVGGDPCTSILTHEILFIPGCSPGPHGVQTVLPSSDATFPKGHTSQLPFLPTFPFGQLEHCTLPLTNVVIPDLQVLHSILPGLVAN